MRVASLLKDLLHLIYPKTCLICGENLLKEEQTICFTCLYKMPLIQGANDSNNEIAKKFWGKVNLQKAFAFFSFQKGLSIQKLLHQLKYKGNKDIGVFLGKHIGKELQKEDFFQGIDIIIPIPLHKTREKQRGFNQSMCFAEGLSESTNIPLDNTHLYRNIKNTTQTKKGVFERWENTSKIFALKDSADLSNQHILLVDDVITTGATLENCVKSFEKIRAVKVSILTIAGVE